MEEGKKKVALLVNPDIHNLFIDNVNISSNGDVFTLNFMQLLPTGDEPEKEEGQGAIVFRGTLTKMHFEIFIKACQETLEKAKQKRSAKHGD